MEPERYRMARSIITCWKFEDLEKVPVGRTIFHGSTETKFFMNAKGTSLKTELDLYRCDAQGAVQVLGRAFDDVRMRMDMAISRGDVGRVICVLNDAGVIQRGYRVWAGFTARLRMNHMLAGFPSIDSSH